MKTKKQKRPKIRIHKESFRLSKEGKTAIDFLEKKMGVSRAVVVDASVQFAAKEVRFNGRL